MLDWQGLMNLAQSVNFGHIISETLPDPTGMQNLVDSGTFGENSRPSMKRPLAAAGSRALVQQMIQEPVTSESGCWYLYYPTEFEG